VFYIISRFSHYLFDDRIPKLAILEHNAHINSRGFLQDKSLENCHTAELLICKFVLICLMAILAAAFGYGGIKAEYGPCVAWWHSG